MVLLLLAVAWSAAGSAGAGTAGVTARTVTVAVVRDGPSPGPGLVPEIRTELERLASGEFVIRFKEDDAFDGRWNADRAAEAVQAALDDPEVDIVLVKGGLTAAAAAGLEPVKPVLDAFVQRPDLYTIVPVKGDRSEKDGLAVVEIPQRVLTDLVALKDMVHPEAIHVAVPRAYLEQLPVLGDELRTLSTALGLPLEPLPVGDEPAADLDAAGGSVQAVLLTATPQLGTAGRRQLIEALNARKIPTFSAEGLPDVRNGVLAGRVEPYRVPLVRRLALDLYELARGTAPADLPVVLPVNGALTVNGATAAAIGFVPPRVLLTTAEFLHPEALRPAGKPLSLGEAFRMAKEHNVGLKIAGQRIETAEREKDLAKSTLLPQISAMVGAENRKIPGLDGIMPDTVAEAGVSFDQMIYDDRRVSEYNSAKRIVEGTRYQYDVDRLETLSRTGRAFYAFVLARVMSRVDRQNLTLTRENLSLARVRVESGYSGKDEIYRWESETAKRESQLLLRQSTEEAARIELNRILGIDQSQRWDPEERVVEPDVFPLAGGRLDPWIRDLAGIRKLADALTRYAEESAPEMRVLDERIAALEIQLKERKRRWYLPVFSIAGDWAYRFHQSPDIAGIDDDRYRVGVYGTYPLFLGGSRSEEIGRVRSELETLRHQRELERQNVERRVRTATQRVAASFPVTRLSRQAAEAARKNFAVVQDKYSQGLVNITDLLEAQNEVFVTEQAANASVYRFFQDLIDLQRAIAWFDEEATPEERIEFVRTITGLMNGETAAGPESGETTEREGDR